MSYTYEAIKFNDALPANIFIHKINEVQSHWHESIEILFVTKGRVNLLVDGNLYNLKENDLIIINSKEIHSVKSNEENIVIAIQINLNKFTGLYKNIDRINFKCKSFEHSDDDNRFVLIRKILAEIIYNYMKENNGYCIKINSLLHELVYIIINRFKSSIEKRYDQKSYKYLERLNRVTEYLRKNYNSDITLSQIANMEYLSPQYFSKFFEKYMGVNFLTYLNSIRLEYAVKDLINTDYNITDIALNNGFANVKSFTSLFKNIYSETPSSYRKKSYDTKKINMNIKNESINYFELNTSRHMDSIFKYLEVDNKSISSKVERIDKVEIINRIENKIDIDLNKKTKKINHSWKNLITIGKAKEGLITDVQEYLREIQKSIGFKYIRFHGVFDDEMMVYDEGINNKPIFNFTYVDKLFDFLLGIGLKPFIELGFMPSKLALSNDKKMFYTNSIISEPKDINKWNLLVEKLVKHCINRYGMQEVETWYFEVWNEPDLNKIFGFDIKEYYNFFFKETYNTIKAINKNLKVGGPSILGHTVLVSDWMDNYINYCIDNNCTPDFFTFHSYPLESPEIDSLLNMSINQITQSKVHIDKNENYLKDLINRFKYILQQYKLEDIEIYMTEWNSTASHRDLTNDTLYKASYIAKNILENIDNIQGFGYWIATDLLEESRIDTDTFHGGLGLITNNGIKKPGFYAYEFLSKLGNELIQSGDGYFVTKQYDTYQIILYNYCHFDNLYTKGDISHIDKCNRYDVFNNMEKYINLNLKNFNNGDYLFKEYTIGKEKGSAFDTWIDMGHPNCMDEEDVKYINNNSTPNIKKHIQHIKNEYSIEENLAPHEVKIYTIKPIY
ncbi:GH39 family glycosyl hydrolase [Romboutsia sp.]|uniref:GH39 family glycosyl hydrolase n=1 Tax=Romboutsia sp. TaxID=1965302 RepID=UPI003F391549